MGSQRPLDFDAIAEARRQWESHDWAAPAHMSAITSIMRAQQILIAKVDDALKPFDLTFAALRGSGAAVLQPPRRAAHGQDG